MKKTLIFIASLALLVSCAKTVEIDSEKGGHAEELILSTIANPTRAIAEGTTVPTNNIIGMLPNFKKDGGAPYNNTIEVLPFGYDPNAYCWRGMAPLQTKGLIDELIASCYTPSPIYWPAGDRISLDYTAYSCSNLSSSLLEAAKIYVKKKLGEMGTQLLTEYGEYTELVNYFLRVRPFPYNFNRLDVDYENTVLNLLSFALLSYFESPLLDPVMVDIFLALCVLSDVETGLDIDNDPIALSDIETLVASLIDAISSDDETAIQSSLQPYMERYPTTVQFITDYIKAEKTSTTKQIISDDEHSKPVLNKKAYEDITPERLAEVVNHAYWIFLTRLPQISKYFQDDLMYAHGRNLQNNGHSAIQATFNHAKAWVKVVVNNQSKNDIFVSGIAFKNINTSGTLIIDNSRSEFEAYWDFSNMYPFTPENPEDGSTGVGFQSYYPATLDGQSESSISKAAASKSNALPEGPLNDIFDKETQQLLFSTGLIPDLYFVPSGCYGPAKSVERRTTAPQSVAATKSVTPVISHYLQFEYLNGDQPFDKSLAANLGGAMFPAQESGAIQLAYYSLGNDEEVPYKKTIDKGQTTLQNLEMSRWAVSMKEQLKNSDMHQVSLNLPRQYWEMGKVYIYVINISDSEITINPIVVPWENDEDNPIIAPEETGMRSKDATETFGNAGTDGWFGN